MPFHNIFETSKREKEKPKPKIIVDYREKNSLVFSELMSLGCEIDFKQLQIGDYIVGETIIERKTVSDFVSSMINKRLIRQIDSLRELPNKLLIIEGIEEQEIYLEENSMSNAVRGMILSIILKQKIPIIFTKNSGDTAKFIFILAKKPSDKNEIGLNDKPKPRNINEQMQYIVEGFPGIGPKTARKLLEEFKTLNNIFSQPIENIEKVIGKKSEVFKILNLEYKLPSVQD